MKPFVRVLAFWAAEEPFAPDEAFEAIKQAFDLGGLPASRRGTAHRWHYKVSFVEYMDPAGLGPNTAIVIWEADGRPTKEQIKQATEDYLREEDKKRTRR